MNRTALASLSLTLVLLASSCGAQLAAVPVALASLTHTCPDGSGVVYEPAVGELTHTCPDRSCLVYNPRLGYPTHTNRDGSCMAYHPCALPLFGRGRP